MAVTSVTDQSGIQNALRKRYASKRIEEQQIFNQKCDPLLAEMRTKEVKMNGGAGFVLQTFGRGSAQGPNRKFSRAGQGGPVFRQMTLQTKDREDRFSFTRNALQDSMDNGGSNAGFNLVKIHVDQSVRLMTNNIGQLMGSDGFGTLGYVSSVTGTNVIVVGDAAAVPNRARINRIYIGQVIAFAAVGMTGVQRSSGASAATVYSHAVTGIDKQAGTFTVAGNLSTSGVTAGDAYSLYGDRGYDAADGATVFYGLDAWAPTAAIGAGDPLGRNGKLELQPIVVDCTGMPIIDALAEADQVAFDNGIDVGAMLFVPSHVTKTLASGAMKASIVQSRTSRPGEKGDYTIGYNSFTYLGMRGPIEIVPSAYTSVARWFDPDIFRLAYVGEGLVNVNKANDGNVYRLDTSGVTDSAGELQSGYCGEVYSRLQLLCDRPGDIMVLKGLKE